MLIFFLYDVRSGLIVAVTIPLVAAVRLHLPRPPGASANLLSIGAIDFGILVDGAVVMVENIYRQLGRAATGGRAASMAIIRDAAAEVDRPIVLRGRRHRRRLPADLRPVRAVGRAVPADGGHDDLRADRLADRHADLLPVLCSWLMRSGVRERRNADLRADPRRLRTRASIAASPRPRGTIVASALLLLASLLLVADVGAEFMPQLDEGALWVRATMPYTISFENRRRSCRRSARSSRSFPEVTTVASEHGRPDDGTDPTGFFNAEFYVGLKPYREWHGAYPHQAAADRRDQRQAQAFPGITFNYTQPAEDAVDEAETGLKSALAVKVFGSDLNMLEQKGKAIKGVLEHVRGIRDVTLVQELGQPSLTIKIDRDKIARYGINVDDINGLIQTAIGGDVATQVVQQEKRVRPRRPAAGPVPRDDPSEIGNILVATPGGQQIPLKELADISVEQRRLVHLPREQQPLHRRAVLGRRARPCRRGRRTRWRRSRARSAAAGLSRWTGAANIANTPRRARS